MDAWRYGYLALAPIALFLSTAAHSVPYTISQVTPIPTGFGEFNYAMALNEMGQLVGTHNVGVTAQGYFWENGTDTQTGILPGGHNSSAGDVNNHGYVVGTSSTAGLNHAFLWDPVNGIRDLGTFPGGKQSHGTAINNANQVVGYSVANTGHGYYNHAFLWEESSGMRDLGSLGTYSQASDINDQGQVVGWSRLRNKTYGHAFVWEESKGMLDIGSLGGGSSANAINASRHVVGYSDLDESGASWHAFIWDATNGMQEIGPANAKYSNALDINDLGIAVGIYTINPGNDRAFLWDMTLDQFVDLNDLLSSNSEWDLIQASNINNAGQIVGLGRYKGQVQSFLMSPLTNAVPEPSTAMLLIFGFLLILAFRTLVSQRCQQ